MTLSSHVAPEFQKDAFNCPVCGAFAHFSWYAVFGCPVGSPAANSAAFAELEHMAARCHRCNVSTVWAPDTAGRLIASRFGAPALVPPQGFRMVYPIATTAPAAPEDLPENCQADYGEARRVLDTSPRAAAALLRLVTEKLCRGVCEAAESGSSEGKMLYELIGQMVARGMPKTVQRALDTLRVVGSEGVHPGSMDVRDDIDTARRLFGLVEVIVEQTITQPRKIAGLYGPRSTAAVPAISIRDKHG